VSSDVPTEIPPMNSHINQGLDSTLKFPNDSNHQRLPNIIAKVLNSRHQPGKTSQNIFHP
jgi:hypothetical protein